MKKGCKVFLKTQFFKINLGKHKIFIRARINYQNWQVTVQSQRTTHTISKQRPK